MPRGFFQSTLFKWLAFIAIAGFVINAGQALWPALQWLMLRTSGKPVPGDWVYETSVSNGVAETAMTTVSSNTYFGGDGKTTRAKLSVGCRDGNRFVVLYPSAKLPTDSAEPVGLDVQAQLAGSMVREIRLHMLPDGSAELYSPYWFDALPKASTFKIEFATTEGLRFASFDLRGMREHRDKLIAACGAPTPGVASTPAR